MASQKLLKIIKGNYLKNSQHDYFPQDIYEKNNKMLKKKRESS